MKNAAVFLDPLACECLHWNGGAPSILDAGATCIKELSAFEAVPKNVKKGVFISSTAWHGTNYKILETLIRNSNLEYCVIITSAHLSVHHLFLWGSREGNESEVLQKIEEDVLEWMGNLNYTVEVFSYPLSTLHPTRETILIPSARLTEPLLTSDLGYLNEQLLLFSKVIHNSGLSCVGCTLVDKNIYCKLVVKEMKRKCSMSVICLFVISSFAFFF
ncbi:Sec1 family domain-containing protein [Daphnia magna]|uniref:Sec1 family domain-containing protein n=1 Tax=Daphnia magna TaxID=35525 RepID=A0A162QU17_9CRUS|nr:Sec1 family domain-containing protein [Daphnia magna]